MNYFIPNLEADFPLRKASRSMASLRPSPILAVVDVYDSASLIVKEFERLIDVYGTNSITNLMPLVIRMLEHLEIFAAAAEKENEELDDLQTRNSERLQTSRTHAFE